MGPYKSTLYVSYNRLIHCTKVQKYTFMYNRLIQCRSTSNTIDKYKSIYTFMSRLIQTR